jgi:uncharacterized protein (DUF1800 family)
MRLSRKVGFGFRPEEEPGDDFVGWAVGQLAQKPVQVGVPSISPMNTTAPRPPIAPWPDKYTLPLEDQITRGEHWWAELDALNTKMDRSTPEYSKAQLAINEKYSYGSWDMVRRAHQAIYGATPVLERFAHFWANHFTVAPKDLTEQVIGHYLDRAIRDNLAGTFGEMLENVTLHPVMLMYLDNAYSVGPKSKNGKSARAGGHFADINENLARELLELHTLSPAGGYTQADIIDVAKILTGWGYDLFKTKKFPGKDRWRPFFAGNHEPGDKVVLGETYKQGPEATTQLLARLASADATIQHLSLKLARYFLSGEPDPAHVNEIAAAWRQSNGSLPAIHQKVIELAASNLQLRTFQQPEVWLYQSLRISGADLFFGFDQISADHTAIDDINRNADKVLEELGQHYWQVRQPNGYSDAAADWASPEQLDRRVRFSSLIVTSCHAALKAKELLDRVGADDATRALVAKVVSNKDKYVLLLSSRDMMEA